MSTTMSYDGALVMPSNYAVMSEDEMCYVEGGYQKVRNWYGMGIKFSGKETAQFLSDASWLAVAICAVAGFVSRVAGLIAGVICGTYGFVISRMNKNNSGVTLMWNWANLVVPNVVKLPNILDNY